MQQNNTRKIRIQINIKIIKLNSDGPVSITVQHNSNITATIIITTLTILQHCAPVFDLIINLSNN